MNHNSIVLSIVSLHLHYYNKHINKRNFCHNISSFEFSTFPILALIIILIQYENFLYLEITKII